MKRNLLTLIALTLIVFTGCSKDSDTPEPSAKDINGKWYLTEVYLSNEWQSIKATCYNGMYAEFKADKAYSTYKSCDNRTYTGTYSISGNLITCKVGSETVTYNIQTLEGNNSTMDLTEAGETIRMRAERR